MPIERKHPDYLRPVRDEERPKVKDLRLVLGDTPIGPHDVIPLERGASRKPIFETSERVETRPTERSEAHAESSHTTEASDTVIEGDVEVGAEITLYTSGGKELARPEDVAPPIKVHDTLQRAEVQLRKTARKAKDHVYVRAHTPMEPEKEDRLWRRGIWLAESGRGWISSTNKRKGGSITAAIGEGAIAMSDGTFNPIEPLFHQLDKATTAGELLFIGGTALLIKGVQEPVARWYGRHLQEKVKRNERKKEIVLETKFKLAKKLEENTVKMTNTENNPRKKARLEKSMKKTARNLRLLDQN